MVLNLAHVLSAHQERKENASLRASLIISALVQAFFLQPRESMNPQATRAGEI